MEILLMGTGASDGVPALYGDSRVSRHAMECGGKDIRTRASALIDGKLKIDFGPDTLAQCIQHRLDPRAWETVVFTHSHEDHFAVSELQYSMIPFTTNEFCPYAILGNAAIVDKISERYPDWPIENVETRSFQTYKKGQYEITPISAYHMVEEDAQNLIISDGRHKILYATDTGVWRDPTWEFLAGVKLDALVIECTDGFDKTDYFGHMDIVQCIASVSRLREMGVLHPNAPVVTTHHSHLGNATHCELESELGKYAITAGFDGLRLIL